jgi:hypothetical protein
MAEKGPKAKGKPTPEQRNVLGTLPATRPERIGAPRTEAKKRAAPKRAATTRVNGAKPAPRHGPTAVRPGSPPLQTHHRAEDSPPRAIDPPRGTELVTTAIRATGELAQIGLTYGGHLLKRAVDRFPRP